MVLYLGDEVPGLPSLAQGVGSWVHVTPGHALGCSAHQHEIWNEFAKSPSDVQEGRKASIDWSRSAGRHHACQGATLAPTEVSCAPRLRVEAAIDLTVLQDVITVQLNR